MTCALAATARLLVPIVLALPAGTSPAPAPRALHSPHDVVEALALSPDFATDRTLFAGLPRFNLLLRSDDAGESWRSVNTGLDTAYVLSLAVSPDFATDDTVWCAEIAGLFHSTDRGDRWEELELPAGMRQVASVHSSPDWARDRTLVAVTQRDGVWLGRARGREWTPLGAAAGTAVGPVALARDEDGGLLLWGLDGERVLRARVGRGETEWTAVGSPGALDLADSAAPTSLVADGDGPEPEALYLATERPGAVMRSGDGGRTWAGDWLPDPPGDVLNLSLARDAADRAVLWASTAEGGIVRRGPDGGWTASREGFREPTHQTTRHWLATRPSPDFARDGTVYAAAFEGLYVSRDAGATWRWLNLLHPPLIRNLALSPRFAEDGGLWVQTYGAGLLASTDAGGSFRSVGTMDWWFPDGLAVSPAFERDATLLVGTPNRLLISRDGGGSVEVALAAKGFARVLAFAPDWSESGTAYAHLSTDTGLGTNRFVYTTDRGATWQDSSLRTVFDVAFASDFASSGRMWAGTPDGLFRSDDRGARFARVGTLAAAGINSVALAPGPAGADGSRGPDLLAAVSRGSGLHLSRDGGASWTRPEGGLDGVRVSLVELSPDFADDGLAFAGPLNAGVHASRDGGRHWTRVPGGPSLALSMAISPTFSEDRTLAVGAYDGPWLLHEAAARWQRLEIPRAPDGTPSARDQPREPDPPDSPRAAPPPRAPDEDPADAPPREPGVVSLAGLAGAVILAAVALLVAIRRGTR